MFRRNVAVLTGCALLSMSLSGCATILSGNSKQVDVQVPRGSLVEIAQAKSSAAVYRGPGGMVTLNTGYSYLVTVKNPGRLPGDPSQEDMILPLDRRLDGATILNVLWVIPVFWAIGVAVDMATGSFWTLPAEIQFAGNPYPAAPRAPLPAVVSTRTDDATPPPIGAPRNLTYDQLVGALDQIKAGHRDVAMRTLGAPQSADADTAYWWAPLLATGDCFVLKLSATKGNSLESAPAEKCN
jgi:hypothetical protein